jgi:hypothetical protein
MEDSLSLKISILKNKKKSAPLILALLKSQKI